MVEKKRYERELRTVNESLSKAKTDYEAKLSVVENARNKLTDDLEDRIQKVAELEAVVQKSGDGENATVRQAGTVFHDNRWTIIAEQRSNGEANATHEVHATTLRATRGCS